MAIDYRDGITIVAASLGFLLGSLVAFALESQYVIPFQLAGIIIGAGLSAYLFTLE